MRALVQDLNARIERFVWLRTIMGIATGLLSALVLLAVGGDHAAFWGFVIFLLSYIPVIGAWGGAILPSFLVLLQHGELGPFLGALIGLGLVQLLLSNIIEPRLVGRSLNLSPVVILLSLSLWGSLWGLIGAFLCVPLTAIVLIVCAHFEPTRPLAILLSADGRPGPDEAAADREPGRG
jgi:predicted PurR-regulated permease PerM